MQRLYPFNTNDKNVMILQGEDDLEEGHKVSMTTIKIDKKSVKKCSIGFKTDYDLVVSPEGFFFFRNILSASRDGVVPPSSIMLSHIGYYTYSSERVDNFIDPRIIATRRINPRKIDIYGVNQERNELLLYNLMAQEGHRYKMKYPESCYPIKRHTEEKFGITLLKLKDGQSPIHAIALLNDNNMAIAYANGEIVLGGIENNAWIAKKQLLKPANEHLDLALLSTPDGKLIAYLPNAEVLMSWDIGHGNAYYMQSCPKLSKLNLSNDGKHLTALLGVDAASDLVLCYQLPTLQLHTFKMAAPISDVAICEGDQVQVCSEMGDRVHFPGKLSVLLKYNEHPAPLNKVSNKEKFRALFTHPQEPEQQSSNVLKK